MTDAIVSEDFVAHLNHGLREGLSALRKAEEKYGVPFVMLIKLNSKGNLQVHVEPEGLLQS